MLLHSSFFVKTFFKKIFKNLLEQVVGIEPTFPAWKAGVLPIYDTCILGAKDGTRTRNIHLGKVALYQLSHFRIPLLGRGDRSRTCDLMVPNHARYHLRHTPFTVAVSLSDNDYSTLTFLIRQYFFYYNFNFLFYFLFFQLNIKINQGFH